ncbi:MAG: helix-turn-helix transcriptional regulator [Bacteroidales bacterium]|nr:helix-turn-helix transcriptional regulator [Bacteroidales bacterium]
MIQPELGKKIAELRQAKGLTQTELAEMCNLGLRTIQRIESSEVNPRSFTLRVIFASLDYEIQEKPIKNNFFMKANEYFNRLITGDFEKVDTSKITGFYLKNAFVAGIIFLLLGFVMYGLEIQRSTLNLTVLTKVIYISLKLILIVLSVFYLGGFIVLGSKFKNQILVISSLISIFATAIFSFYEIFSLFYNAVEKQSIDGGKSITFGIIEIIFGIGLLRLSKSYGKSASLAGIFNIIEGFFFLTVIFWFIGSILTIPAQIFEIVILYKAYKYPQLLKIKS